MAIERVNLPRREGGRGIIDIIAMRDRQVKNMREYFHRKRSSSHLIEEIVKADDNLTPLSLKRTQTEDEIQIESKQQKMKYK